MRPALVALEGREPQSLQDIRARVAEALQVSEDDQAQLLPSGKQTTYSNRVAWALTHMGKAGLVSRPSRAHYSITPLGKQILEQNPHRVDMAVLAHFPAYQAFRTPQISADGIEVPPVVDQGVVAVANELSPSEAVGRVVRSADTALADELLDRVIAQPPAFLERLSLRLLQAMGYGGRESLTEHTGKPGDAGLDGLVRQDALGLELVGVQAKRFEKDATVNRPIIQAFVGALSGAQTTRGVFVTTGRFTQGAREFAESVNTRLVLIDGEELARLMVRYNVGASVRETFELKQVDEDIFEE